MAVELRNCSLEIAYIGTEDQIQLQIFLEKWPYIYDQIIYFCNKIVSALNDEAEKISEFFNSDDGKKMLITMGVK